MEELYDRPIIVFSAEKDTDEDPEDLNIVYPGASLDGIEVK